MLKNVDKFDRSLLKLMPLCKRKHKLTLDDILPLKTASSINDDFNIVSGRIHEAKRRGAASILMMGAHVIRAGVQRYIIDLMKQGYLKCVAMNGAGVIHDFEFSLIGATTESVPENIKEGYFGFWRETTRINDIVSEAAIENIGLGEAVGRTIEEEGFPYRDISILAAGYRLGIPVTVHVGIGYDIVHQAPNCKGEAYGATSYTDFLKFTEVVKFLEGGVVATFGSSVMAPEIFLKALSMGRNIARQSNKSITSFTTLVCDLVELPENYLDEAECQDPRYYFRPWKTMLIRTVAEGGNSYYVRGWHHDTVPQLWTAITTETK
jgi:hypothetical protein